MMEADRAVNLLEHQKEIHARPARQWIVSQQRKVDSTSGARSKLRVLIHVYSAHISVAVCCPICSISARREMDDTMTCK